MDNTSLVFIMLVCLIWYAVTIVQMFLSFGTAYRKTKANGDNGIALFGWMIVYQLASILPYLGIYLWKQSKTSDFK